MLRFCSATFYLEIFYDSVSHFKFVDKDEL